MFVVVSSLGMEVCFLRGKIIRKSAAAKAKMVNNVRRRVGRREPRRAPGPNGRSLYGGIMQ